MKTKILGVSLLGLCLSWTLPVSAWDKDDPKGSPPKDKKEDAKSEVIEFEGKLTDADPKDAVQTTSPHKVHVVKLKAGQTYQIDLIRKDPKQEFDPFLRVEDADKTKLAADDDSGGQLNSRIMLKVEKAGDYRIIATALFGNGDYVLRISPPGGATLGAVGAKGITAKGRVAKGAPAPQYRVKLAENKSYVIDMVSEEFDTFLELADANGKTVARDDDGGGGLNARISFTAPAAGDYIITTRGFAGSAGNFTLTIREANP